MEDVFEKMKELLGDGSGIFSSIPTIKANFKNTADDVQFKGLLDMALWKDARFPPDSGIGKVVISDRTNTYGNREFIFRRDLFAVLRARRPNDNEEARWFLYHLFRPGAYMSSQFHSAYLALFPDSKITVEDVEESLSQLATASPNLFNITDGRCRKGFKIPRKVLFPHGLPEKNDELALGPMVESRDDTRIEVVERKWSLERRRGTNRPQPRKRQRSPSRDRFSDVPNSPSALAVPNNHMKNMKGSDTVLTEPGIYSSVVIPIPPRPAAPPHHHRMIEDLLDAFVSEHVACMREADLPRFVDFNWDTDRLDSGDHTFHSRFWDLVARVGADLARDGVADPPFADLADTGAPGWVRIKSGCRLAQETEERRHLVADVVRITEAMDGDLESADAGVIRSAFRMLLVPGRYTLIELVTLFSAMFALEFPNFSSSDFLQAKRYIETMDGRAIVETADLVKVYRSVDEKLQVVRKAEVDNTGRFNAAMIREMFEITSEPLDFGTGMWPTKDYHSLDILKFSADIW
ncbi:hypothetical protein M427DRAFT_133135 [Gonapodya prolifera JEL478]|uniref:Uncharacterized protein n=1 Tax=Gonapodya prolifera (strain JEL478) TaxID=1344416 RepID=A0A139AMK7_GONPJ|nr:hypothetical protein M427DRAFT_133135 [Gonapodya prolifera JEL478]|eukprot:KXS18002.1 hypothetical protein M427DRAFT_133135 [Gonapodya prolifera JEL478]